jgi:hypothetical protein
MKYKWRKIEDRYGGQTGKRIYLGKLAIGDVFYSPMVPRDAPAKYQGHLSLKGFMDAGLHVTEQEAMEATEALLDKWLEAAGLEVKRG